MTSTFVLPWRKFAGCPTHVDKRVKVGLQTLVRLPLQPRQHSELGPVECLHVGVIHHPEGRHGAVEVRLLPTGPPRTKENHRLNGLNWILMKCNTSSAKPQLPGEISG